MDFPHDFPRHLQHSVEKAIAQAEVNFLVARKKHWGGAGNTIETLLEPYIVTVFFAFARQARKAGLEEPAKWTGERIRNELEAFLGKLIVNAYYTKHPSHGVFGDRLTKVTEMVRQSPEWLRHQKGMAALAQAVPAKERKLEIERFKKVYSSMSESTSDKRKSFIEPLLLKKGWSIEDWAGKAGVSYHTASDYLSDSRKQYRSTIEKLAKALEIPANELP